MGLMLCLDHGKGELGIAHAMSTGLCNTKKHLDGMGEHWR